MLYAPALDKNYRRICCQHTS